MAKMIQMPYDYSINVPIATAQAVQEKGNDNPISLEALGLLVNLLSYPSTWELHKTELYKRFGKNKEASVKSAWNDLMTNNYIIEFKYRVGKKWEYVYYFRKVPFTSEEKTEILDTAEKEYGSIWGLDFQDLKMKTSKSRGNQKNILNKQPILNINNQNINNIDDDKRTLPSRKGSAKHNDEYINLLISNFREATKDELTDRSFKAVIRKVMDKYNQGKIIGDLRDYLVTALTNKIELLEFRRQKDNAKEQSRESAKQRAASTLNNLVIEPLPFYNWLEQ